MPIAYCAICLETKPAVRLAPCGHSFCAPCLRRQLAYRATCPTCRVVMAAAVPPLWEEREGHRTTVVRKRFGATTVGVRLRMRGAHVRVERVVWGGAFWRAGVRKNQVVLAINGLPCHSVRATQQLISSQRVFTLTYLPPPGKLEARK